MQQMSDDYMENLETLVQLYHFITSYGISVHWNSFFP